MKLPLPRLGAPLPLGDEHWYTSVVDETALAALERAYALLRARCEAAEILVDMALRGWKLSRKMNNEAEWQAARAAHREVDNDA